MDTNNNTNQKWTISEFIKLNKWKLITELWDKAIFIPLIVFYFLSKDITILKYLLIFLIVWEIIWASIKIIFFKNRPIPMPYNNLYQKVLAWSFPSVHTMRSISFFLFSIVFIPIYSPMFFMNYILVAASRVILKKHFVIDIIWWSIIWIAMFGIFYYIKFFGI